MNWQDDEDVAPATLARRDTYIPALPASTTAIVPAPPAWVAERQPLDLAPAFVASAGAVEHTSAMDRARALRIRLIPFALAWGVLAVVVGAVVLIVAANAPGAALAALLTFAGLTAGTYIKLNAQDYAHSREGTIRHQVDVAAGLARDSMNHEHELRKMALENYLRALDKGGRQ